MHALVTMLLLPFAYVGVRMALPLLGVPPEQQAQTAVLATLLFLVASEVSMLHVVLARPVARPRSRRFVP